MNSHWAQIWTQMTLKKVIIEFSTWKILNLFLCFDFISHDIMKSCYGIILLSILFRFITFFFVFVCFTGDDVYWQCKGKMIFYYVFYYSKSFCPTLSSCGNGKSHIFLIFVHISISAFCKIFICMEFLAVFLHSSACIQMVLIPIIIINPSGNYVGSLQAKEWKMKNEMKTWKKRILGQPLMKNASSSSWLLSIKAKCDGRK